MKRILLTSYQKSGTHQALQMLMHAIPHIVDYSGVSWKGLDKWKFPSSTVPIATGLAKTEAALRKFDEKAFGHIPYLPQYASAVQAQPTTVIFNVRDPRDVVVSELETIKKDPHFPANRECPDGRRVVQQDDPLSHLIEMGGIRWRNWLGWLDHDFVYLLHYEDLRLRGETTTQKLVGDLPDHGLSSAPAMLAQARNTGWSPTFRKGLVGEWKTYFKPHHVEMAREHLAYVMDGLGYEEDDS